MHTVLVLVTMCPRQRNGFRCLLEKEPKGIRKWRRSTISLLIIFRETKDFGFIPAPRWLSSVRIYPFVCAALSGDYDDWTGFLCSSGHRVGLDRAHLSGQSEWIEGSRRKEKKKSKKTAHMATRDVDIGLLSKPDAENKDVHEFRGI